MKIKPIASNQTELHLNDGTVVLFSYQTPVAVNYAQGGFARTSTKWSKTTSKHINQWLGGAKAKEIPQSELDSLAA